MKEPTGMLKPALQALPQIKDRMTFLYLERCQINRQDSAITVLDEEGIIHIPAATISVLLLGPGTTVTHRAMELIGDAGVSIVWVGERGVRYYAGERPLTHRAGLLIRQAELVSDKKLHLQVVRKMYQLRFPGEDISKLTLPQLRGREGARVRHVYQKAAEEWGVTWNNTTWKPIDLDGIHLMKRPLPKGTTVDVLPEGFSKAAHYQKAQRMQAARIQKTIIHGDYTVIDLETSGLHAEIDKILELGAIRIRSQDCIEKFSVLLKNNRPISQKVVQLTGITEQVLQQEGIALADGLRAFLDFIGNDMLVGHNVQFDFAFLREACRQSGLKMPTNRCRDTLDIARKRLKGIQNYKLATLAEYFSLDSTQAHRVLPDCDTTHQIYQKLQQK